MLLARCCILYHTGFVLHPMYISIPIHNIILHFKTKIRFIDIKHEDNYVIFILRHRIRIKWYNMHLDKNALTYVPIISMECKNVLLQ